MESIDYVSAGTSRCERQQCCKERRLLSNEREVVQDSDDTATLFAGRGTPAPLLEFAQACLVS